MSARRVLIGGSGAGGGLDLLEVAEADTAERDFGGGVFLAFAKVLDFDGAFLAVALGLGGGFFFALALAIVVLGSGVPGVATIEDAPLSKSSKRLQETN